MLPLVFHGSRGVRLVIGPRGEWFQVDDRARVSLETRSSLRRLLVGLAESSVRSPGTVLPVTGAFAIGWPNERASPAAAAMRVYTAIHSLRRFGLRGLLVRRHQGYLLDAAVQLAPAELPAPAAEDFQERLSASA